MEFFPLKVVSSQRKINQGGKCCPWLAFANCKLCLLRRLIWDDRLRHALSPVFPEWGSSKIICTDLHYLPKYDKMAAKKAEFSCHGDQSVIRTGWQSINGGLKWCEIHTAVNSKLRCTGEPMAIDILTA